MNPNGIIQSIEISATLYKKTTDSDENKAYLMLKRGNERKAKETLCQYNVIVRGKPNESVFRHLKLTVWGLGILFHVKKIAELSDR
jgi:hypothetical protein